MKKSILVLLAALFLGSTGLVLAQETAPASTPVAKVSHKAKRAKKMKKMKKAKKVEAAPATTSTTPTN
ncbi:MAG TPA: hypothetical protein VHE12_08310 [bacterium]|nr:hypothetical protein [bacterium]